MKHLALTTAITCALAIAACGNKSTPQSDAPSDATIEMPVNFADLPDAALAPEAWLEQNAKRKGVVTTSSGLQYSVNKAGDASGKSPTLGQIVKVHYEGRLTDGSVFDSSYERGKPSEFPSDRLVPGWVEALAMMKPGDEWTLYVPPALGYGAAGSPPAIPANAVMVFKMELLGLDNSAEVAQAEIDAAIEAGKGTSTAAQWLAVNTKRDGVITTESGLQYSIIESGDASGTSPDTASGQYVQVHYEGRLKDGTVFDSSYARGEPAAFPSNALVPGWVEALGIMKPGDQWIVYLSPELGYGPGGRKPSIPADAVMIFRMDLLQIAQ